MSELDRLRRQRVFVQAVLQDLNYEETVKFENAKAELEATLARHGNFGFLAFAVIGAEQALRAAEEGLGEDLEMKKDG